MNSASNSGTQPMISHESALQLQNISKSYTADTKAVDGVDLEVRSGEFFSLLGPSGCGKTTILRMLAGFEVPTEGKLLVEGKDFTNVPPHRRGMSMVFQNYALFPHRTVMENVAFGLRMRRVDRQSIREKVQFALSMVSLTGLEQRKPAQLSGGQQQRVALARALVVEPKVLLCDEPLAALDKKLRQSMQIELKQLQQRLGVTLVFVTHDQEEALAMSDRIAVMNAGKLEQIGSPAEIYNRPRSCFVADFIGDTNLFKGEIEVQDGSQRLVVNEKFSIALPVCAKSVKPIAVALRPEKISLSPGGEGKSVKAKGTIEGIVFQGQGVLIRVLLEGGQRILAREANDGSPPRFQIHQPIDLDWASGDVTLLWK